MSLKATLEMDLKMATAEAFPLLMDHVLLDSIKMVFLKENGLVTNQMDNFQDQKDFMKVQLAHNKSLFIIMKLGF